MQPTQQNCIPILLYSGPVSSDPVIVGLDITYDHLITKAIAKSQNTVEDFVLVQGDNNLFYGALLLPEPGASGLTAAEGLEGVVMQNEDELILQSFDTSGTVWCGVFAYRLAPSADTIFS
jgi:hypothetical protein